MRAAFFYIQKLFSNDQQIKMFYIDTCKNNVNMVKYCYENLKGALQWLNLAMIGTSF